MSNHFLYNYHFSELSPYIGRWNAMDQLSENYMSHSPYAYVMNNPVMMTDPDGRQHRFAQAFESSPDFNNNPQRYLIGAGGRSDSWNMLNNWAPIPTTPTTLGNNAAYKDAMNFLYGDTQGTFKMTNQNGVMTWWTELGQEKQGMIGTYNMLKRKTGYQTSNYNFNPYQPEPSSMFDDVDCDRTIKRIVATNAYSSISMYNYYNN